MDGVVGQARGTVAAGHLGAEQGADGAVDVAHGQFESHRMRVLESALGELDQRPVQRLIQAVVLISHPSSLGQLGAVRVGGHGEHRTQVEALALPVGDAPVGVEHLGVADGLVEAAKPELGQVVPDVFGDEPEEVLDELGFAVESGAQFGVLGGDSDGAGVEVADPHHDAAGHHQRGRGEAVLLGAEQRSDDDVACGAHAAVALHGDAVPQAVEHQRLLGVGEADLPRHAGMFEAGQRCGAGAAVVARDEDDVGVRLGHAGRDGADTDGADQLDVDARVLVGVLQVVDELGEVLDRIDVVVRRRRDQTDAGCRVPGLGDVRIHLEARKLTTLTGFGTLSHLDLDVGRVDQVVAGDTEAAGGDLLDGAAPFRVVETVNILTALTGVRPSAYVVHGDGHGFVGFGGDGTVTHRTGIESGDDRLDGFDFLQRHGSPQALLELEEPP